MKRVALLLTLVASVLMLSAASSRQTPPLSVAPIDVHRDLLDYCSIGLTALLVIVGGGYTFVAYRQLGAIGRQADIAERELVIANRAYLYLSGVRLTFLPPSPESNLEITYPVFNGGQTPALFTGDFSRVIVAHRAADIGDIGNPAIRKQTSVIPPRGADAVNAKHWTYLSDDELADIENGTRKLFFYGFLFYFDVFQYSHKTWFALSYSGPRGRDMPMGFVTEAGYNRFD
jgi:hypothetical protein